LARFSRYRAAATTFCCLIFLSACSSQPPPTLYYRTVQTELTVESATPAKVKLDNRYVGDTPVTYPLLYDQEVENDVRNVTWWQTQPALAVVLTILTLGVFLPLSLIPADTESSQKPLENYRNNHFIVAVDAPGYAQWKQEVYAKGDKTLTLHAQMVQAEGR
jgi:hypothetical protein